MLIFPSLIAHLEGSYAITTIDSPAELEENKIPDFEGE